MIPGVHIHYYSVYTVEARALHYSDLAPRVPGAAP